MGLFDAIERLNTGENQPVNSQLPPDQPVKAISPPRTTATSIGQPFPAKIDEHQRILNRKPERLSFLAPCPVCHGRSFVHIEGGGFACRTCQPRLFGYPVEATGPEGHTPDRDPELFTAGWSNDVPAPQLPTRNQPPEEALAHFAAAWPWIRKHRAALLAAGWTMAALVRRAKYSWPCGPWGVAWLPVWSKPGVKTSLARNGKIQFVYESNGRTIKQTATYIGSKKTKKQSLKKGQ